jgi:hypothetical protein
MIQTSVESGPSLSFTGLQRRVIAHPVSQVALTLGKDPNAFSIARNHVLSWINSRAGRPLPQEAWSGSQFELEEIGAQHAEGVAIDDPRFWAARFDDADKEVASRTWITEAAIGQAQDGTVSFGARLTAVVRGNGVPFERSVPRFVRDIVANLRAECDGRVLSDEPWLVESEADVEALVALISNAHRRTDVIVIALADNSSDLTTSLIHADDIARRTLGAAHVAVVTGPASFMLTDQVGKEFSVFRQAVRTYRPGFNLDLDEPFRHPLSLAERILAWPNGPLAYSRFLIAQSLMRSISASDRDRLVPAFLTAKRVAAQIRLEVARDASSSDAELVRLYETEIDSLRQLLAQEKEKADALLVLAEDERDEAIESAQQARETAQHLRIRIQSLERARSLGEVREAPFPNSLDDAKTWCEEHLAGAVELHSRAYRGIKSSQYDDVRLIFESLLVLRDYYVPMRRGGGQASVDAFRRECNRLHLEEGPTGSEDRANEQGDEYFVRYGGSRIFLDRHLKKGNSKDPRYSFRLYFFWDESNDQVVVGWLPSHLDSRIT